MVSRFIFTSLLLVSFLLGGIVAKAGYVICIEPNGIINIEEPHHTHCDVSSHQIESDQLNETNKHSHHESCESEEQHESHQESTSKFIAECFPHCLDVPISVQNTLTQSSPKAESSADLTIQQNIFFEQSPKRIFMAIGSSKFLNTINIKKAQKLDIIKTVILTI